MLAIEVQLLTGRYVATAYDDRSTAEWPPHPARLFSALVATHSEQVPREASERDALQWLEALSPPEIAATDASPRELVTVFVPVNDTNVTGLSDEDQAGVLKARDALAAARENGVAREIARAERTFLRAETRLSEMVARALAPAANPSKEDLTNAPKLLPEQRGRQARTFPSVMPVEPNVVFVWPSADATEERRRVLDRLASRVVRLGHSSSLVSMRVIDRAVPTRWRPDDAGRQKLRVVQPGQLDRLDAAFELHHETEPRVMPCAHQPYLDGRAEERPEVAGSSFDDDWLVLRRVDGPRLPSTAAAGVARAIRAALMKHASQPAPHVISGHHSEGVPSDRPHLAVVPLPWVGHRHADGTLLGVALVVPRGGSAEDRRAVYRAVAGWESEQHGNEGELPVLLGAAGVWKLERLEQLADQLTLRPQAWCGPASEWATATPIALDRHPGDLNDRNAARQARAYEEAEATVRAACEHIGLPAPAVVNILPFAPVAGARKARHFPPFPSRSDRARRQLVHASIQFEHPVGGPILLGAGRYLGLGLLRPVTP